MFKRLFLLSIFSLSLFTPKANAIVPGGCLVFPFLSTKAVIATTLVAHGAYEGGKAALMKLLATRKTTEQKGN